VPIVTTIGSGCAFYHAEDDRQDFLARQSTNRCAVYNGCRRSDDGKARHYRADPVLAAITP
jgi:peptide methionine sulfoxide reductase MsrA